jgi:hypothetical protein
MLYVVADCLDSGRLSIANIAKEPSMKVLHRSGEGCHHLGGDGKNPVVDKAEKDCCWLLLLV